MFRLSVTPAPSCSFCSRSFLGARIILFILLLSFKGLAGHVTGLVREAESAIPMAKVKILLTALNLDVRLDTETDQLGMFQFVEMVPGDYQLIVSAVGYGFVKKSFAIKDRETLEFEILLSPGTQLREELTVTAGKAASSTELSSVEVDKLKSVLLDDPVRAVQQLPGFVGSDEFSSSFAFQGSGFDRVGVLFDGIPVYGFFHTVAGLEDTGSTTLLSADLIDGIGMVPAGASGLWSGNSAGYLNLRSRTGNGTRWRNLLSVSGSSFLYVSEGPLSQGSWIASARKSYVDWIVRRIDAESNLNFGFHDFFAKTSHNFGPNNGIAFSVYHGNTGLHDVVEGTSINSVDEGRLMNQLVHLEWDFLPSSKLSGNTHFYFQRGKSTNRNQDGFPIWNHEQRIFGVRTVWDFRLTPWWSISTGVTADHWSADHAENIYSQAVTQWLISDTFDVTADREELMVVNRLDPSPKLALVGGWSWSRREDIREGYYSPFAGFQYRPSESHTLSCSWGKSGQFPFFQQVHGIAGDRRLVAEKARTFQGSWFYGLGDGYSLTLGGYHRTRDGVPWRREGLWRLVRSEIAAPSLNSYKNALDDRSYGAEIRVGKSAPNGLSGWIGYAWGVSRWSEGKGDWFPGNYDQRHGLGLFLHYRWTSEFELSLKLKSATGIPLPAYAEKTDQGLYYLASRRNEERLPTYGRFDFRLGKSFNRDRYRMTLFVEILNLFDRENLRFSGHDHDSVNPWTGRIYGLTQKQFPFLPTAGLIVEF